MRASEVPHGLLALLPAREDAVHLGPDGLGHLVVPGPGHVGGTGDGVLEDGEEVPKPGVPRQDVPVGVKGGPGGQAGEADGVVLLDLVGGQVLDQVHGLLGVAAVGGDHELPAAQGGGVGGVRRGLGQDRDPELAPDGAPLRLAQGVGVGPVAHEEAVALLPDVPRLLLGVAGHALGGDPPHPAVGPVQGQGRPAVVDADGAVGLHDAPAPVGVDPLQGVAGEALVGLTLEDEPPEVAVARPPLPFHDPLGHLLQLVPGPGRARIAVLLQEVLAVVKDAGVGEEGQGGELAPDGVVLDDTGEELLELRLREVGLQVQGVGRHDARPDDVNHVDVHIGAPGGPVLLVEGEAVVGVGGGVNVLHPGARLLPPGLHHLLHPAAALAHGGGVPGHADHGAGLRPHQGGAQNEACRHAYAELLQKGPPLHTVPPLEAIPQRL